ncbi:unknown protein [Rivularia sp. IAM M-261]|nr:unknown protein [Calothrix sp. PCC 7716]GJD15341.1 unknown protein [Rivularia sp. IAM M-261]
MMIDNYDVAKALTKKLEASLPIRVRPGKEFLKTLKKQEGETNPDREYEVIKVMYAGDDGGIMCALASDAKAKQANIVSLTHLQIDPNHPLASEVESYQRQRVRNLMLQNKGGFKAELLAPTSQKNKKPAKGFGK